MSQNAKMGCRSCLVESEHRSSLAYDLTIGKRYHYRVDADRRINDFVQEKFSLPVPDNYLRPSETQYQIMHNNVERLEQNMIAELNG